MQLEQLGPYRIERQLGQGGMGTVFAGVHQETGQVAAIKVLSSLLGTNKNFRVRFEGEIETLKKLRHPHIVQLFGYGEHEGHLFYAMELVEGRSLHDALKEGHIFPWRQVLRFGIEICTALKHAHDSGVIHRDLKPANLLLAPDGHLKLTDFGIAKLFGSTQLTADGGIVGTADYMSPEQAEGIPVTHRCDLYSLGSVMYALLARRPPFTGRSVPQVLHALRFDPPTPLRRLVPDIPDELETIILQLLEKDPQKRLPTALVAGNRLKAFEHSLAVTEKSPPPVEESATNLHVTEVAEDEDYELQDDPAPSHSTRNDLSNRPSSTRVTSDSLAAKDGAMTWDEVTEIRTSASEVARLSAASAQKASSSERTDVAPVSSVSRFTTIAEDELRRARESERPEESHSAEWIKYVATAAILLVLAGAGWLASRPPSAEKLYQQIATAAETEEYEKLFEVENEMQRFLENYATDSRAEDVRGWQAELMRQRQSRSFDRRARRSNAAGLMNAAERAYLEAVQFANTNPESAVEKLQAVIDVFDSGETTDETTKRTLDLARGELQRAEKSAEQQRSLHLANLESQLDRADEQRTDHPENARRVYQGIITLYAEKPWAKAAVERAKTALEMTVSNE